MPAPTLHPADSAYNVDSMFRVPAFSALGAGNIANMSCSAESVRSFTFKHSTAETFFNPASTSYMRSYPDIRITAFKYWTIWSYVYSVDEWTKLHLRAFRESYRYRVSGTRYLESRTEILKAFIDYLKADPEFTPLWLLMFGTYYNSEGGMCLYTSSDGFNKFKADKYNRAKESIKSRVQVLKSRDTDANLRRLIDIGAPSAIEHFNFIRLTTQIIAGCRSYQSIEEGSHFGNSITVNDARESLRRDTDCATFTVQGMSICSDVDYTWILKITETVTGDRLRRTSARVFPYSHNVCDTLGRAFYKSDKESKPTFYGVELELTTSYTPAEMINAQPEDQPLFYLLKSDGSIRGSKPNPYELVTVPMSLVKHKTYWAHVFDKLDYENFDRTVDTNNGMHVHVDRNAFDRRKTPALPGRTSHGPSTQSMSHMDKFGYFFINPCNYNFLLKVSERTPESLNQWAKIPSVKALFAEDDMEYGNGPLRGKRPTLDNLRKNVYTAWRNVRGTLHYGKSATIEVRMFKGIVSFPTIIKNLEFVDSVMEFTRCTSQYRLNLSHYNEWFYSLPKNKYATLREFYEHINMRARVTEASLMQSIYYYGFKEQDVLKGLNKLPRDTYEKVLKIIGKGTFQDISRMNLELDEVAGRWSSTGSTSRRGIMSSLDKILEKKFLPFNKNQKVAPTVVQPMDVDDPDNDDYGDEEDFNDGLDSDNEDEDISLFDSEEELISLDFGIIEQRIAATPHTPTTYPDDWQPDPALFVRGRSITSHIYPPRDMTRSFNYNHSYSRQYAAYYSRDMQCWYFCHNGRFAQPEFI